LTPALRTEINAANLLAALVPQSSSETRLVRQIRRQPIVDEAVRARALERAHAGWQSLHDRQLEAQLKFLLQYYTTPQSK
jgi:hypothetical protein